ncbi:MAG: hypothetical protein M0P31_02450 [Solirubrobacteraceae bacterium]|nr:hypothetical protein [Solirubrobacteraceae bacterium]
MSTREHRDPAVTSAAPAGPRVLDRLPALSTTGVGSLPFPTADEAARHAVRGYDLPFLPQMPRHDGDMVAEWLGAATPCGWTSERDRERPFAWDATVAALAARPPEHGLVKLQVTGPVTLATALERGAGRAGARADVVHVAREIGAWLAANVREQVDALRGLGLDALVVVDEPGLARSGIGDAVDVWDPLARVAAAWGLHVCGAVPWATVRAADPDVLSFDVTRYAVGGEGAAAIGALVTGGSRIAWGAIDPVDPGGAAPAVNRVVTAIGACAGEHRDVDRILARSLLTPACGTGRLSPRRERLVAATLAAAADLARTVRAARTPRGR